MKFVNIASLSATALTALIGLSTVPASAGAITYDFTLDNCSGSGCGLTNYGSVTVTDIGGGGVTVHLALLNGSGLVSSGALDQHTLIFNLSGSPSVNITGLPNLWSYAGPSPYDAKGNLFGIYNYVIDCNAGCGTNNPYTSALDFTITTASITTASFIDGGTAADAFFVADISNPNGRQALTGRIGATTSDDPPPPTEIPEPLTMSLFGAGLAGIGALRRRKKQA